MLFNFPGDFSPVNTAEQIWGMIYMLLNIVFQAWVIGSITLLIVKGDEKTGLYRDTLEVLAKYAEINNFDASFTKKLRNQIKLSFNNREVSDEQVLRLFPASVRRKVLRKLYLPSLMKTSLMKGLRQQFLDAFLAQCYVEVFSPGEELLQRSSVSSDLYLLVEGTVKIVQANNKTISDDSSRGKSMLGGTSIADTEYFSTAGTNALRAPCFINDVSFFCESPQTDTVVTITVCKMLSISHAAYRLIAQDHPASSGKLLQNLLARVEEMAGPDDDDDHNINANTPHTSEVFFAGSSHIKDCGKDDASESNQNNNSSDDITHHKTESKTESTEVPSATAVDNESMSYANEVRRAEARAQSMAVRDLVKMHNRKQKDDHTMRFLYAATRGDTAVISVMCEQGLDPNSCDYDSRTALMVASVKGNTEVVVKLLEHGANPNLVDNFGFTALYEAAKNRHEDTMKVLLEHGASMSMSESLTASALCQAVFDGDVQALRQFLKAKVNVDAADYDKRTAAHIAAAEGNVAALKVLIEFGSDWKTLKDRWGHSVMDEARSANAGHMVEYLKSLK